MIFQKHPDDISKNKDYESVIEKIDNKETFLLVLAKKESDMNYMFDYYIKTYNLKAVYRYIDETDEAYNKLIKKLGREDQGNTDTIIQYVNKGIPDTYMIGLFAENDFKSYLINSNLIDKEYEDIDRIISGDFKDYYKDKKSYCILYLSGQNENSNKYRSILVKNKIRSLVMYADSLESIKAEKYFKGQVDFGNDPNASLPAVIKVRDNKILYASTNVTEDNLVEKCK